MWSTFFAWIAAAVAICALAAFLGRKEASWIGILIDERGRYSLTRLQLTLWTVTILSLVFGVFWGRLGGQGATALEFKIPSELLTVMGISVGSTVLATTIKTTKDSGEHSASIAASDSGDADNKPFFSQIFMVEEGSQADKVIDISKFQNFWITIILVLAYIILAISTLHKAGSPGAVTALPGFGQQFTVLLAISHAGYLIGKVPNKPGEPAGLSVVGLQGAAKPAVTAQPAMPPPPPAAFAPAKPAGKN